MNKTVDVDSAALAESLDTGIRSWVETANREDSDFPIQNLPFCVYRDSSSRPRIAVAIGDSLIDLSSAFDAGVFSGSALAAEMACRSATLNELMSLGRLPARAIRVQLSRLLRDGGSTLDARQKLGEGLLVDRLSAELLMPVHIGDYTDFYASVHHATNVGRLFRPDNPLLPNYKWVPIGYHGRASSIVVDGAPVKRPEGQRKGPSDETPVVGPSRLLDYELEVAAWTTGGNALGTTIPLDEAESHLFGLSLLNDWSARDLQAWEYQPLGPFLAKSFISTISPYVVTLDALEPFRAPLSPRAEGDPEPLPYLFSDSDREKGGFDISLEVKIRTAKMRETGAEAELLSKSNLLDLYWTFAQMLAHHSSNGCNMRAGDLLGSGTVSGPNAGEQGCLLELTRRGAEPVNLSNGEKRSFLENGDEVIISAYTTKPGSMRIGFGECKGVVVG